MVVLGAGLRREQQLVPSRWVGSYACRMRRDRLQLGIRIDAAAARGASSDAAGRHDYTWHISSRLHARFPVQADVKIVTGIFFDRIRLWRYLSRELIVGG